MRRSDACTFSGGTPAFSSPAGELVSSVSTSMMSPEAIFSAGVASLQ